MVLTQEYLKEILDYNPDTGDWFWIRKPSNGFIGDKAGNLNTTGYIRIKIDRKEYKTHRLAFLYMTGKFPPNDVDHLNRIRDDNRWDNLRLATRQENMRNRVVHSNNKLQVKGVYENKSGKYAAQIRLNKKPYHLGTYSTKEEASMVYNLYAEALFGEFYHND